MSRAMMAELATIWERLGASDDCRCIIITGAGDRAFCAGADIGDDLSAPEQTARMVDRALLKTKPYSKPIIAAVNGDCAGGGVELLLSTDIRLAAEHARFGLPEVKWSIYPFGGATVKLVQQIGYVHAMDLLLSGRLIAAQFAASIGLINRVLPAPDVMAAALETAVQIWAHNPSAGHGGQDPSTRRHCRRPRRPGSSRAGPRRSSTREPLFRGRGRRIP